MLRPKKRARFRRGRSTARRAGLRKRHVIRGGRKKISSRKERAYRKGCKKGYEIGFETGKENGIYLGGENILETMIPGNFILPEVPVDAVIASGLETVRDRLFPLIPAEELGEEIIQALNERRPMSIARLGDGELLALAQGSVLSEEEVRKRGPFLSYAGVDVPDYNARDQLLEALRQISVVGIPQSRQRNFQPLAFAVFRAYGIDYKSLRLTDSLINYRLHLLDYMPKIISGRRILTVGNVAPSLAKVLMKIHGVQIAGAISPVEGVKDVPRVMNAIREKDFDLALVSAGIPAVLIVQKIASEMGKVAIDFGHLADSYVEAYS